MTHPYWPFFDLRVRTPRLELRGIDDEMATELTTLAAQGIHEPDFMPFAFEWTDVEPPQLQVNTMQFYWRCRAEMTPAAWNLNFAVVEAGVVVGTTGMMAEHFPTLRTFESGSWLGRAHHGRGIGTEMRIATLHLGFLGFGARVATTAAFSDNGPSLGVTRKLGYTANGDSEKVRRGAPAQSLRFTMSAEHFAASVQRDDIELIDVEPCLPLLGL